MTLPTPSRAASPRAHSPRAPLLRGPLLRSTALLGAALGLAACTVGPDFRPPTADAPAAFADTARASSPTVTLQADPDPRWWNRFNDPVLTSLVERAIRGNLDLQQAVLRIAQARQSEAQARAAGLPSLNANARYTRQQLGLRGILEDRDVFGQIDRNSSGSNNDTIRDALNGITQPINIFQAGFDASWELDLFGRVRRSVEQANAQTQAQREAANDALITLQAEVVQAYANVRGAQALAQSQRENVATAQGVLDLTQRQRRQGLVTELDVENQRAQLFNYQAQLPTYERQLRQAMNRLSLLLGQPPGSVDAELEVGAPIPPTPPVVAVGVPASLARRRPDIRRAEANLHAATASVGVAVARFYPDISLTGSLGTRAADLSYLTNWASHFYALGPSISLPIFQGGTLTAGLRLARAQQAEAALAYRSTVLTALNEVDNNLVAYRTDRAQRDSLQQTVNASQNALYLARERYEHGLSSFIDVLDAQRTLVAARQQLLQATLTLTTDLVSLYKSLGGGWEGDTLPTVTAIPPPGAPGTTAIESLSPDSIAGVDKPGRSVPLSPGVGPGGTPVTPAAAAGDTAVVPYPGR